MNSRFLGPQNRSGHFRVRKNILSFPGIAHGLSDSPSCSVASVPVNLALLAPLHGDDLCLLIRFVHLAQQTGFKISVRFMMNDVNPASGPMRVFSDNETAGNVRYVRYRFVKSVTYLFQNPLHISNELHVALVIIILINLFKKLFGIF